MSYIRSGWGLNYVIGASDDYIWSAGGDHLEDYGGISNKGIVEFLCYTIDKTYEYDLEFAKYLKTKLAHKLGVFLREEPLEFTSTSLDASTKILMGYCAYCVKKTRKNRFNSDFCYDCKRKLRNRIKSFPDSIKQRYYETYPELDSELENRLLGNVVSNTKALRKAQPPRKR